MECKQLSIFTNVNESKYFIRKEIEAILANLYQKTGLKNLGTVFLMTDAQVADEKFLVLINNLLASGEIPDLFTDDEVENVVTMVRNEVKGAGLQDTRENCWKFFIDRVRKQLKVNPREAGRNKGLRGAWRPP